MGLSILIFWMQQDRMLLKICSYVQIYLAMSKEPTVEEKDQAKGSFPRGIMQSKENVHKHLAMSFMNT